jgi:citronellol/citronellal dehydrogenase
MKSLAGKTVIITGSSRGIGRAIALRCAQDGANVAVLAKTAEPNPKVSGTIHTVAKEIEAAGGKAMPIQLDLRDADAIQNSVHEVVKKFGGVDVLVNNAGVLNLTDTMHTPMKRFDLMLAVNVRATFCASQACIPLLSEAENPHILNIAPPLNLSPKWFKDHLPYTISKYGMSMCTLGMSAEFADHGIAVNSLWPQTAIATAAIEVHFPPEVYKGSRKPEIMSDAAHWILTSDSKTCTGNFYTDEQVLQQQGCRDLSKYAIDENAELFMDAFLD